MHPRDGIILVKIMNMDIETKELIEARREELVRICGRRGVVRLELFGSASTGESGPGSDLDFLVEFKELPFGQMADAFFGLQEDLENLFGRRVDLVEEKAVTNPFFLRSIEGSRELLYAA